MARSFDAVQWKEFVEIIAGFPFTRKITDVHLHHTWRPRQQDYRGLATIQGMWRYHTQEKGWSDIAQHVTVAPDGEIWLGRNFNWAPASAVGFNGNASAGPFMIEMIGDFDPGRDTVTDRQRQATLAVIKAVHKRFGLPRDALTLHNEMSSKSCPGGTVAKSEWIKAAGAFELGETSGSTRRSPFGANAGRAAQLIGAMKPETAQTDLDAVTGAEHPVGYDTLRAPDGGERGLFGPSLTEAMIAELSDHVVNLELGRFSGDGRIATEKGDVDRLFGELLPNEIAARDGATLHLLFYAHGGLVSETNALLGAYKQLPFWRDNGIYPVFFIWETGFAETIKQMLSGASSRAAGARGARWSPGDFVIEELARTVRARTIWSGMKRSAERASAEDGGAAYVAGRAAQFLKDNAGKVEIHTIGHSAGAIFQAHFMPRLIEDGGAVRSAHYLAPAIRNDAFFDLVEPRLGEGKGIGSLTLFTMRKQLERADTVGPLYRKSLLYLIHKALEPDRNAPILGLEVSLRRDRQAAALFGLNGAPPGGAEVVWSRSDGTATGNGSQSDSHGGFDDDPATMESVARRILDRRRGGEIRPFPATRGPGGTDLWGDQVDWPDHLDDLLGGFPPGPGDGVPSAPPQPLAAPGLAAPAAAPVRRRRALCIGVDNYRHISALNGCLNDARLWQRSLTALGYTASLLADPDAATIRAEISALIADSRAGDSLVVQFAGHGTQFEDADGDEVDGDTPGHDECICAVDCGGTDADGLVIDDELHAMFAGLAAGSYCTTFFDCCHSGTMNRAFLRARARSGAADRRPRFVAPTPAMRAAYRARLAATRTSRTAAPAVVDNVQYSACRSDQLAYENNGQGDFTRHACAIIGGGALGNVTNSGFRDLVVTAFGSGPQQNPGLHCDASQLGMPFLQLAG